MGLKVCRCHSVQSSVIISSMTRTKELLPTHHQVIFFKRVDRIESSKEPEPGPSTSGHGTNLKTNREMDKDVRTMKCYSVIKRNKIVPSAEMWTDPEIIIWSEERKKNSSIKYHIILLICGI